MKKIRPNKVTHNTGTKIALKFAFAQLIIWDKVFKNGPSKICAREPEGTWSAQVNQSLHIF